LHCCCDACVTQEKQAALSTQVAEHQTALAAAQSAAVAAAASTAAAATATSSSTTSSDSAAVAQQSAGDNSNSGSTSNSATDNNGSSSSSARRDSSSSSRSNGVGGSSTDTATANSTTEDALSAAIGAALGLRSYDAGGRRLSTDVAADVAPMTSSSRGTSYGTNGSFRYARQQTVFELSRILHNLTVQLLQQQPHILPEHARDRLLVTASATESALVSTHCSPLLCTTSYSGLTSTEPLSEPER
jgi:hypothetical protein